MRILFLCLCAVLACLPARAEPEIDRDALIFYLRDGEAALTFTSDVQTVASNLQQAEDWLMESATGRAGLGEALANARKATRRMDAALPDFRTRSDAFPDEGPAFPPVFFWNGDWRRQNRLWLDFLALQSRGLTRQVAAAEAGDWMEFDRLANSMSADRESVDAFFRDAAQEYGASLPDWHPEQLDLLIDEKLWEMGELHRRRNDTLDEEAYGGLTREYAERLAQAAADVEAAIARQADNLTRYETELAPFVAALVRDPGRAPDVSAAFLQAWRDDMRLGEAFARLMRDQARLEMQVWQDGWTTDVIERYYRLALEADGLYRRRLEGHQRRLDILLSATGE